MSEHTPKIDQNPELVLNHAPITSEELEQKEPVISLDNKESLSNSDDQVKIDELNATLTSMPPAPQVAVSEKEQATFSLPNTPTEKKSSSSKNWFKKVGLIAAASLVGFLPAKAKGGDDKNKDKQSHPTEVKSTVSKESSKQALEIFELTDQHKKDWNELIDSVRAKHLNGSKLLNSKKFSDKVINDFIKAKQAKGETTTVSPSLIASVQNYLLNYRDTLNAKEADLELHHGTTLAAFVDRVELKRKFEHHEPITPVTYMDGLKTGRDGIFGEYTSDYKFPDGHTTITTQNRIKGTISNMKVDVAMENGKTVKVVDEGFETPQKIATYAKNAIKNADKNVPIK